MSDEAVLRIRIEGDGGSAPTASGPTSSPAPSSSSGSSTSSYGRAATVPPPAVSSHWNATNAPDPQAVAQAQMFRANLLRQAKVIRMGIDPHFREEQERKQAEKEEVQLRKREKQQERDEAYAARQELQQQREEEKEDRRQQRQQERDEDYADRQELRQQREEEKEANRQQRQQESDEDYAARMELRQQREEEREAKRKQRQQESDENYADRQELRQQREEEKEAKRRQRQQESDEDYAARQELRQQRKEEQEAKRRRLQQERDEDYADRSEVIARKKWIASLPKAELVKPEKPKGLLDSLQDIRGSLGGLFGPLIGAILDITNAMKKGPLGAVGGIGVTLAIDQAVKSAIKGIIGGGGGILTGIASTGDPAHKTVTQLSGAISSFGEKIPVIGQALVIVGEVGKVIGGLMETFMRTAERFGEYNPFIAQELALAEIRQVFNDVRRAQQAGPEMARMIREQSEMQQRFEELKMKIWMKILPILSNLLASINSILGVVTDEVNDANLAEIDPTAQILRGPMGMSAGEFVPLIGSGQAPGGI